MFDDFPGDKIDEGFIGIDSEDVDLKNLPSGSQTWILKITF